MKNRTLKVIIILIVLLFLNIEAAQAGLIQKFKIYIGHEFPGWQLFYIVATILTVGLFIYIIFIPIPFKEKGKFVGNGSYSQETYQNRKIRIKKISEILNERQRVN